MSNPRLLRSRGQGPHPSHRPQCPQHPCGVKQTVEAQEVGMKDGENWAQGQGRSTRPGIVGAGGGHGMPSHASPRPCHQWTRGQPGPWAGACVPPSWGECSAEGEMGRGAGGPAAAAGEGTSGSRPGEKLYIHQNLKQKPHSRLSGRLWLLW